MVHASKQSVDVVNAAGQSHSMRKFFFRFSNVAVSGILGEGRSSEIEQPANGGRAIVARKNNDGGALPSASDAKETLACTIREFSLDPSPIEETAIPTDIGKREDAAYGISDLALVSLFSLGKSEKENATKKAQEFIIKAASILSGPD